jgi:hypothetical protein
LILPSRPGALAYTQDAAVNLRLPTLLDLRRPAQMARIDLLRQGKASENWASNSMLSAHDRLQRSQLQSVDPSPTTGRAETA